MAEYSEESYISEITLFIRKSDKSISGAKAKRRTIVLADGVPQGEKPVEPLDLNETQANNALQLLVDKAVTDLPAVQQENNQLKSKLQQLKTWVENNIP